MTEDSTAMTTEIFEQILTTLWISGGQPDRRLQERFGYITADLEDAFGVELERRIASGEIARERHSGDELLVFRPGLQGTLRNIVEPYLTSDLVPAWSRKMVKGAVRFWFELPGTCSDEKLLEACDAIPLHDLWKLPDEIYQRACAIAQKRKTAPHYRTNLRSAMEWAAGQAPLAIAVPSEWCRVENDVTGRMIESLAAVWADGNEPSKAALSDLGGPNPGSVQRRIEELEAQGRAALRPHEKCGRTLLWINLSNVDVETASLADAVRAYLDSGEHSERQKRAFLSALRKHLDLDNYVSRDRVLMACSEISCRELHGFARQARESFIAHGASRKGARTMASALRTALRWTAERRLVPMVFQDQMEDPWQKTKRRWIPTGHGMINGASRASRYGFRTSWGWYEEAIRDLYSTDVHPEAVTADMADAALIWTKERGRFDRARAVSSMLNWLAKRDLGPRAHLKEILSGDPLLKGADGDGCTGYERFLEALDHNGLPGEWREFFEWYRDFSTLPWEDLDLQLTEQGARRFPDRAPGRELGANTLHHRTKAIRWILGISKDFLGVDLTTLGLHEAFGEDHLRRVFAEGRRVWRQRYDADELSSPYGTSIQQYVIGVGLLAEALYELRRHQAGHRVAIDTASHRRRGVLTIEEEGAVRSPVEEQLWRGYRLSRRVAGNLKELAEGFGSAANKNTVKDITEILRKTPPDWYWDVHQKALALARRSLELDGESEEHHRLIRDVYTFGVLLSTGMRGQELAHVRIDLQYPEREWSKGGGDRCIVLHKLDRKNERGHTCVVRDVFVPGWLERAYLEHSRPWLMRNLDRSTDRWEAPRGQEHHHLIVDNGGEAIGCVRERADRGDRDPRAMELRINWLRGTVKNRFGRIAWERCGRKCPTGDGEFTLHTIRNVMGYFLYQRADQAGDEHPALAAANYLGDNPSMVQDVYGGIDGSLVRSEDFERMAEWGGVKAIADTAAGSTPSSSTAERSLFEVLRAAREEIYRDAAGWGMDEREVEEIWEDRRRRIMEEHSRASRAA